MARLTWSRCCLLVVCLLSLACLSSADIYLHNPRGSNNRLNEQTAPRTNAQRVFNSQNNNRGGYNVGDRTATSATNAAPANPYAAVNPPPSVQSLDDMFDPTNTDHPTSQHSLVYVEGSVLQVEWTNQHGCGGAEGSDPYKLNCDLILQYMCETGGGDSSDSAGGIIRGAETLRDGGSTTTPTAPKQYVSDSTLITTDDGFVRHESANYYYECGLRLRNQGLFIADQNLATTYATSTRQNAAGTQYGLECPEERDYYPYWNPSPWKDIAVLTDHVSDKCTPGGLYNGASQNNHVVYRCVPSVTDQTSQNWAGAWGAITEAQCGTFVGQWISYTHNLPAPACVQAPWSRVNHLGNGRTGQSLGYNWTLPTIESLIAQGVNLVGGVNSIAKCALRIRYNISTDDFSPSTDYHYNGVNSPVKNNQQYDIGAPLGIPLQLQLNTAQLARTFQDRSHVFYIATRPAEFAGRTIYNLNVRGKRCNIVECYPAVEYDFVPSTLSINASTDLIHVQWTGSNTHNNGGGANDDGQDGDTGQGAEGTDRNNLIQLASYGSNFPIAYDQLQDNMMSRANCFSINGTVYGSSWAGYQPQQSTGAMTSASVDCALFLWSSGYYINKATVLNAAPPTTDSLEDLVEMNNAPASLIGGVLLDYSMSGLTQPTTFPYLCTRNNAFSNRAQKGTITVNP